MTPNQLTAGAMVLSYWMPAEKVNPGLWVLVFHIVILIANYIGIRWFGEIEFYLSALKVLILLALITFMVIMTTGKLPSYDQVVRNPTLVMIQSSYNFQGRLALERSWSFQIDDRQ